MHCTWDNIRALFIHGDLCRCKKRTRILPSITPVFALSHAWGVTLVLRSAFICTRQDERLKFSDLSNEGKCMADVCRCLSCARLGWVEITLCPSWRESSKKATLLQVQIGSVKPVNFRRQLERKRIPLTSCGFARRRVSFLPPEDLLGCGNINQCF